MPRLFARTVATFTVNNTALKPGELQDTAVLAKQEGVTMSHRREKRKVLAAYCPACGSDIHFRKLPRRGNHVTCGDCQSLLEVVRLAPLTLQWAFEDPLEGTDLDPRTLGDYQRSYEDPDLGLGDSRDDWEDLWGDWDEETGET